MVEWCGARLWNQFDQLPVISIGLQQTWRRHYTIYIHNNLTTELITKGAYSLEFLAVSVSNGISKYFCISLFYRPPSSPVHVMDSLFTTLETLNISSFSNFVLIGDFNINLHNPSCFLYPKLSNILQSFSLSQVVQDTTHNTRNGSETLIDLALVSSADHVKDCSVIPPLLNSDHNGILLKLKWKQGGQQTLSHKRKIWRYAHADFVKACNLIENTNWDSVITGNVNEALANGENTYMQIMEECIPQKTIPKKSNLPWLTRDILRVGRRRTLLYRRAKKSGSTRHLQQYKSARNMFVNMLRNAKRVHFNKINNANQKLFWKTIKYLQKTRSTIPVLTHNGASARNDIDKANMLNEFFKQCFNTTMPPLDQPATQAQFNGECPTELLCTETEVLKMLQSLDTTKSNGPDGISARMLKSTAHSITPSVTKLFNIPITAGMFPNGWKHTHIIPIPKSSNHSSPTDYRPISLLSILSKLLERHVYIYGLIADHVETHRPLSTSQWGFQAGKSTVTALLSTTHNILNLLEAGNEVCAVFFDFRKAFDSVPHRKLLDKLQDLGLDERILQWVKIASYPGPLEKSEKRAWYPLFAHALNFPTFREFRIIPWYLRVPWRLRVHCRIFIRTLLTMAIGILPCCMPYCDLEAKREH